MKFYISELSPPMAANVCLAGWSFLLLTKTKIGGSFLQPCWGYRPLGEEPQRWLWVWGSSRPPQSKAGSYSPRAAGQAVSGLSQSTTLCPYISPPPNYPQRRPGLLFTRQSSYSFQTIILGSRKDRRLWDYTTMKQPCRHNSIVRCSIKVSLNFEKISKLKKKLNKGLDNHLLSRGQKGTGRNELSVIHSLTLDSKLLPIRPKGRGGVWFHASDIHGRNGLFVL